MQPCIEKWHRYVKSGDLQELDTLLADSVVFHSPVVHTPQCGIDITKAYLSGARAVFSADATSPFTYVREIIGDRDACLEFEATVDGIHINGIDLIRWNEDNEIIDFKVMVRPLKAINMLHQNMAAQLAAITSSQS